MRIESLIPVATALIALAGVWFAGRKAWLTATTHLRWNLRREEYGRFVSSWVTMTQLLHAGQQDSDEFKKASIENVEAKVKVTLYGSPRVVLELAQFSTLPNGSGEIPKGVCKLLEAMRDDLGGDEEPSFYELANRIVFEAHAPGLPPLKSFRKIRTGPAVQVLS